MAKNELKDATIAEFVTINNLFHIHITLFFCLNSVRLKKVIERITNDM